MIPSLEQTQVIGNIVGDGLSDILSSSSKELSQYVTDFSFHVENKRSELDHIKQVREDLGKATQWGRSDKRDAPRVTFINLVLAGGGGKGLAYPGVYTVLKESGYMEDIGYVAGSSAGALTAAAIACGADPYDLATSMRGTRFLGAMIQGNRSTGVPAAPKLDTLSVAGIDSGQEIYEIFRHIYVSSFRKNAETHIDGLKKKITAGKVKGHYYDQIKAIVEGRSSTLTFGMLGAMYQVNRDVFKHLVITGSYTDVNEHVFRAALSVGIGAEILAEGGNALIDNLSFGLVRPKVRFNSPLNLNTVYFNSYQFPDLEIALAARMSMSLPAIFDPIYCNIGGTKCIVVDGGITSNIPVEALLWSLASPNTLMNMDQRRRLEDESLERELDRTMIVVPQSPEELASAKNMLTQPHTNGKAGPKELALGLTDEVIQRDWKKVNLATGRSVMPMPHGDLGTTSFLTASAQSIFQAQCESVTETVAFLQKAIKRKNRHRA